MRTMLTLADDVAKLIGCLRAEKGRSLQDSVNPALGLRPAELTAACGPTSSFEHALVQGRIAEESVLRFVVIRMNSGLSGSSIQDLRSRVPVDAVVSAGGMAGPQL